MNRCIAFLALALLLPLPSCENGGRRSLPTFDPLRFADAVDHPLFPLRPGTASVLEGDTADGFVRVVAEVTGETKTILGVACVVVRVTETVDGELSEETLDWFQQDLDGNVWYFGEESKEYEDGALAGTDGSWEAGVLGAEPGLMMLASPDPGTDYPNESAPGIAEDRARVVRLGASVTTPLGAFDGCLETEDSNPLDPGLAGSKFYARGIGLVLEIEPDGSRIELVSVTYEPEFDPEDFLAPGKNPFYPLAPGTRRLLEKETDEGIETIEIVVTAETKTILGVPCAVVRDTVRLDGELVEETLDWLAVDRHGNVWYFGEESKDYEDGLLVGTEGSWEAGVGGALPGILLPAEPAPGVTFRQELAPGVAEDMATVRALGGTVEVPAGLFPDCIRTEDFTPLDPGVSEWKSYAPGVGLVLEEDEEGERTELVEYELP